MDKIILNAQDISITFGGLKAVTDFNLQLKSDELLGLIGPNGAGKTTVFNILTGVYEPTSGEYEFNGRKIGKEKPSDLVQYGMARTFQNIRLFRHMTVLDNVMVANNFNMKYGYFTGVFRLPGYWKEEREARDEALELLEIFNLAKYADYIAGNMPYGRQRKLEIARALATGAKVLFLDEPAAGMNPKETEELMETIKLIKERFNIAIILIEHDMKLVLGICERLIVLDRGHIIAEGDPMDVVNKGEVIKAYLGSDNGEDE